MPPASPARVRAFRLPSGSHPGEIRRGPQLRARREHQGGCQPFRGGDMPTLSDLAVPLTGPPDADQAGSDAELLAALRAGDSAAFAAVVDTWSPLMLRVAQRYVGDR